MTGIGAFLLGFGMFMLIYSGYISTIIAACIIYTIGEMIFFSMSQLVCYQFSEERQRGKTMGLYEMVFALSTTFSPTLGGWVYHLFGGQFLWLTCGLMGSVGLILAVLFCKIEKNPTIGIVEINQ